MTMPAATRADGHRLPTTGPSPDERQRSLVRQIAADPDLILWLREHVAAQLEATARAIPDGDDVFQIREGVLGRAAAHRRGETPLW